MDKWKWNADQRFVVSDSWDGSKLLSFEKDKDYGFSWPQRNYKCSFCKKEFKSAQALGGHMNVHRRDRARMRLSSPSLIDSPNPNPNPNNVTSSSPSATTKVFPYHKAAACNDSTLSCVSNTSFSCYADKELHLGPNPTETFTRDQKVSRKQIDISFENVSLVRDVREICGGDRGKKKKGEVGKDGRTMLKANGVVRLDLSMGTCFVGDEIKDQDLDLELRLGYC